MKKAVLYVVKDCSAMIENDHCDVLVYSRVIATKMNQKDGRWGSLHDFICVADMCTIASVSLQR